MCKCTCKSAAAPIDLTKAKPGDKVLFRCGGEETIVEALDDGSVTPIKLSFDGGGSVWFKRDGRIQLNGVDVPPYAIIALEPAPGPEFDWATVKPGMAFEIAGDLVWYIGPGIKRYGTTGRWFEIPGGAATGQHLGHAYLHQAIRRPAHDIDVPQAA
jgi:hypothetical protein